MGQRELVSCASLARGALEGEDIVQKKSVCDRGRTIMTANGPESVRVDRAHERATETATDAATSSTSTTATGHRCDTRNAKTRKETREDILCVFQWCARS